MNKVKKFFIAILLGILGFILYAFLLPFSKIHFIDLKTEPQVEVQDLYIKKEPEIRDYLEIYRGRYLWSLNLKKIAKEIKAVYLGGEVYIKRKLPNRLIVHLKAEPTFLLLLKSDDFFYSVSYNGSIGAKKNRTESLNFPILRGQVFEKNFQLRQKTVNILLKLPKMGGLFSLENISEILYNEKNSSFLFYLAFDHFILELVSPPSLKKIKNIDFVLNYLKQQGRTRAFVDARLEKKIIVKKIK